ncbi:hypothetical protein TNCV_2422711 [Trichonephila clavipes]|nr:hypothetical protein TNCV_2422711 [Trichonephila clavipes]
MNVYLEKRSGVSNNCFVDDLHVTSFAFNRSYQLEVLSHYVNMCSCILPEKCRISIIFLVKFKKPAPKILQILTEAYEDETFSRAYVFEWYKQFSGGRDSVKEMNMMGVFKVSEYRPKYYQNSGYESIPCPTSSQTVNQHYCIGVLKR